MTKLSMLPVPSFLILSRVDCEVLTFSTGRGLLFAPAASPGSVLAPSIIPSKSIEVGRHTQSGRPDRLAARFGSAH